ncbi:MAG: 23S rRNA (uracil(1939)-C(5))-methyltransferase RlmD [Candidatus Omnitrophica bacterium]|nr:23S rRNA (uracil(1939)-C(5))-methyltransferase RlmD [Candidatus Omnitrophota bacterium]
MNPSRLLEQDKSSYPTLEAPCPYFGACGGCALQDLAYEHQLALKRTRVARALATLPSMPSFELIGLEDPWRYRNKAELTFGESNGRLTLGFHAARSFWRVVDLPDCLLLPRLAVEIVNGVRELAQATGLPVYHTRTHQGFFRSLIIRSGSVTGQVMACLVTSPGSREVMSRLAQDLRARHPNLTSVYWGITTRLADVAVPEELVHLEGAAHLDDQLGPFRLRLHPLSFLQPNSRQADRMYTYLCDSIRELPRGIAWDLYCGVGVVGFYLAKHVGRVYGIDVEPHHVELAGANAALNGLGNMEFRVGRVETLLLDRRSWLAEAKPDLVVVDPPRAGLHPHALSALLAARPMTIAYIACNVQSLARDLRVLLASFPRYQVRALRAFDMFPHTNHAETVALLTRRG